MGFAYSGIPVFRYFGISVFRYFGKKISKLHAIYIKMHVSCSFGISDQLRHDKISCPTVTLINSNFHGVLIAYF